MNANSKLKAPSNSEWLSGATKQLQTVGIPSARLDAELLLADSLGKDRTWLIAHPDEVLEKDVLASLEKNLSRRLKREPLAYIRGYKEFYGRNFRVTPDTLIPRPETETIVEIVKRLPLLECPVIHDVGTGTGCIGITLALELPSANVSASDFSSEAVQVARENAEGLHADINIRQDDLMNSHYISGGVDAIVANLPYVDTVWDISAETHHEPSLALFAEDRGLALIKKLIGQAETRLLPDGFLVLEADPRQHDEIIALGHLHGFDWYETDGFIVVLQKN